MKYLDLAKLERALRGKPSLEQLSRLLSAMDDVVALPLGTCRRLACRFQMLGMDPRELLGHEEAVYLGMWDASDDEDEAQAEENLRWYSELEGLLSTDSGFQYTHAITFTLAGQYEEAIVRLQGCLQSDPDVFNVRFALANALRRAGHLEAAVAEYEEALRIQPGTMDVRCNLGLTLNSLSRFEEAEGILWHALGYDFQDVSLLINYCDSLVGLDRSRQALEFAKCILVLDRNNYWGLKLCSEIAASLGEHRIAENYHRKLSRIATPMSDGS